MLINLFTPNHNFDYEISHYDISASQKFEINFKTFSENKTKKTTKPQLVPEPCLLTLKRSFIWAIASIAGTNKLRK